jgi:predicted Zn-dependent protease
MAHEGQGARDKAISAYHTAIQKEPGSPFARAKLAMIALAANDGEGARKQFDAILENHPGHLPTLLSYATLEMRTGNYKAMETRLREAISANPQAARPRLMLSRYLILKGQNEEALNLLQEQEPSGEKDAEFLQTLGLAQLSNDMPEKGLQTLQRARDIDPKDADIHFEIARANAAVGNARMAESALRRALELEPDHAAARLAYTKILVMQGDVDKANETLSPLRAAAPEHPDVMRADSLIASARKRPEEALERWKQGDRDGAVEILEQWVEEHPDDTQARLSLADFYSTMRRPVEAVSQYEAVLQKAPDNLEASQPRQSLDYARKAVELAPDSVTVLDTYAMVLAENREFAEAERTIDRTLELQQHNIGLQIHKAEIMMMAGKRQAAKGILDALLREKDDFPTRARVLALLDEINEGTATPNQ